MKCPKGYKYSKSLKMCVKKNGKRMRFKRFHFYGRPLARQEPKNGKGNGNGNGGNGNGNGNGGNGNGGNGNGGGGNGSGNGGGGGNGG
jgi:hypothetical protein